MWRGRGDPCGRPRPLHIHPRPYTRARAALSSSLFSIQVAKFISISLHAIPVQHILRTLQANIPQYRTIRTGGRDLQQVSADRWDRDFAPGVTGEVVTLDVG